jgi:hypothetical protein
MKVIKNPSFSKMFILAVFLFPLGFTFAQDSIPARVINKSPLELEAANTFDFIVQRDYLIGSGDADTASLRGSGSWFLGLGFKIPIAKNRLGFRISPRFNWLKINYDHTDEDKRFPIIADTVVSNLYPDLSTITDPEAREIARAQLDAMAASLRNTSYELQRQRLTYIEVPVGLYFNITTDEETQKAKACIEAGGTIGYNIGNIFKYRSTNRQDQSVQTRVNEVPDVESFRYGWYARAGFKKIAATFTYRSSYLFSFENAQMIHKFPQMQLGLTVML